MTRSPQRKRRPLTIAGVIGRSVVAVIFTGFLVIVGVQFAHMAARNIATARELSRTEHEVSSLRARKIVMEREIERLSDPRGAIPEIHDRLHMSGPHEAIIYLKATAH